MAVTFLCCDKNVMIKSTLWKEVVILACSSKTRLIMAGQLKQDTERSHLNHMQKTQRKTEVRWSNTFSKRIPSDTHLFQKAACSITS